MNLNTNIQELEEQGTSMKKTIILQCTDIHFSNQYQIAIPYDYENRQLDLGHSLHRILKQIFPYKQQFQVFYYNPLNNFYIYGGVYPFKMPLFIGEQFIHTTEISVRIRRVDSEVEEEWEDRVEGFQKEKKKRFMERTIQQAVQKVTEWREISQKSKVTLEEAAKMVGIAKKTLDDYYSQIKLASEYEFDFQNNLDKKIGILRKFVKQNHMKKKNSPEQLDFLDHLLKREYLSDSQNQEEQE